MPQYMNEVVLKKVALFITRGKPGTRHLLVFDHAGETQIPAGTVLQDETPSHAAQREGQEETGLPDLTIIADLGSKRMPLGADDRVLVADGLLQLTPDSSSTVVRGTVLRRGMQVRLLESAGDYVRVLHEVTRTDVSGETVVTARRSGWLPATHITGTIERHFFHMTTTIPTADHWSVQAEPEHIFTLRWVPLKADIRLGGQQQEWLDSYFRLIKG